MLQCSALGMSAVRVNRSDVFLTAGARAYQKHVLHGPETVSIFVSDYAVLLMHIIDIHACS